MEWEDLSQYRNRKWKQQWLFDFPEEEKEVPDLPFYLEPKNDNQKLFNLQRDYYNGNKNALAAMFQIMSEIAPKIVNIESKSRQLNLPSQRMNEIGYEAVMIFIESIIKKQIVITKSFIAYLRLQVLRALFYYTKSMQFEKWLKERNISFFYLSDYDKEYFKELFEEEIRKEKKEKEENK